MGAQRLGIGIIGMRTIGSTHAQALKHCDDDVDLVAVSGGEPDAAARTGWPDARVMTPEQVLADSAVDVVVVCSPSEHHAAQALAALEAGKHVVVEKPLALRVADAYKVAAAAAERGLSATMIAQRRFEPEHQHLKTLLDTGGLGRVVLGETFVRWHRDDAYYAHAPWRTSMDGGGGSLMNQGVHNVDLLQWLLGPVEEVTAQYATLGHAMDAEDTTVATVRFASGALGLVATSTATPPGRPAEVSVHTSTGSVTLTQDGVQRWDVTAPAPPSRDMPGYGAADPAAIGVVGHLTQWRDIVAAISAGRAPAVSAEDGARTVRLLCAIYEAGRTGRAIRPEELS